jgi:hypothetical protein
VDRELTQEEVEALVDLEHNLGYKVILDELKNHYQSCIEGLKGAKNWDDHVTWMSRIGLLEEMIPLRSVLLLQDSEDKKSRLENKED